MLQSALVTLVHLVGEEHLAVVGRGPPALVQGQVCRGGLDQEEDLLPLKPLTLPGIKMRSMRGGAPDPLTHLQNVVPD